MIYSGFVLIQIRGCFTGLKIEIKSWNFKYEVVNREQMFQKRDIVLRKKHPDGNWPEGETWLRFIGNFPLKFLPPQKVEIVLRNFDQF